MTTGLWDRKTFVEKLRAIGVGAYHDKHPFHVAMNAGWLSPDALRGWVANRFYYQRNIPIKDAAILANCPVREVRRAWIHRILEHDGVSLRAVESDSSVGVLAKADVLSGEVRTISSVFRPAPVVVRARAPHPRDLEELPQLDTRFVQGLA